MHSLEGKHAFITGGAAGIGRAIAENFLANGAKVSIADFSEAGANVADEIGAFFARCDVSEEAQVEAAFSAAVAANGRLHIIVLNAGIFLESESLATSDTKAIRMTIEYSATKAGAAYFTRTVAIEEAHRGIRANVVCPACIAGTGMMTEDDGGPEAQLMSSLTALGRMGKIDEVVSLYNYLASDASAFITGQEIRIDGGMTTGIGGPLLSMAAEKAGLG
jgi:meso-butanediol dehydrogenase/(S,S)-butanediol dehydrogenase/diacetyl reductase